MRDPCDIAAAASTLERLVTKCMGTAATPDCWSENSSPLESCGLEGWCEPRPMPNYPDCVVPEHVANTCLQSDMVQTLRREGNISRAADEMVSQWIDCTFQTRPVEGRPFTTDSNTVVLANVSWGVEGGNAPWAELTRHPPAAADEALAKAWLLHGQHEHASLASFSRFGLELLKFAAPSYLLLATHRAAAEEVVHAAKAWGSCARALIVICVCACACVRLYPPPQSLHDTKTQVQRCKRAQQCRTSSALCTATTRGASRQLLSDRHSPTGTEYQRFCCTHTA